MRTVPHALLRAMRFLKRELDAYEVACWMRCMRRCGAGAQISPQASIWGWEGLAVGERSVIHQFTHIFASGGVEIGQDVMISSNCSISSVTHPVAASPRCAEPLVFAPVRIGDNVWIGMGAVILPGVTIGEDAVVGAGAVVTGAVPPRTVVTGNPARVLRQFEAYRVVP
jgi:maltose O-acetyltransferase